MRQTQLQSVSELLIRLRNQAMKYNYGETLEEMLRDQLVLGVFREDIRRKLVVNSKLTLQ